MRRLAVVLMSCLVVAGCSKTDAPEPATSASTVVQQQIDDFCQDVHDAIESRDARDPEDQAERLEELQEAAQNLGVGTRDDMFAADALTQCADELQAAIDEQ